MEELLQVNIQELKTLKFMKLKIEFLEFTKIQKRF